jgi:hypothetical protein
VENDAILVCGIARICRNATAIARIIQITVRL